MLGALTIGIATPNPTVTTLATNFNCTTYTQTVTTTTFNINGFVLTCSSTASYNAGTVGTLTFKFEISKYSVSVILSTICILL